MLVGIVQKFRENPEARGGDCADQILALIKEALPALAKEAGLIQPQIHDVSLWSKEELEQFEASAKAYLEAVKEEGIKEVVEWLNSLPNVPTFSIVEGVNLKIPEPPAKLLLISELESKLKEWGINNDRQREAPPPAV